MWATIQLCDLKIKIKIQILKVKTEMLIGANFMKLFKRVFGTYSFIDRHHTKKCQNSGTCDQHCINSPHLVIGDIYQDKGPLRARILPLLKSSSKGKNKFSIKTIKQNDASASDAAETNEQKTDDKIVTKQKRSQLIKKDIEYLNEYYQKVLPLITGQASSSLGEAAPINYTLNDTNRNDVGQVYGLENDIPEDKDQNIKFIEITHRGQDDIIRKFKIGHGFTSSRCILKLKEICQKHSRVFNIDGNFFPAIKGYDARLHVQQNTTLKNLKPYPMPPRAGLVWSDKTNNLTLRRLHKINA